jgi:hypothetical protein
MKRARSAMVRYLRVPFAAWREVGWKLLGRMGTAR